MPGSFDISDSVTNVLSFLQSTDANDAAILSQATEILVPGPVSVTVDQLSCLCPTTWSSLLQMARMATVLTIAPLKFRAKSLALKILSFR